MKNTNALSIAMLSFLAMLIFTNCEKNITADLPDPFVVFATQNPIEHEGTYPLPEAQLDRFLLEIDVGYPDREAERRILLGRLGAAEEVARAVRFLLSQEASYVTAAEFVVDGGNISSQRM